MTATKHNTMNRPLDVLFVNADSSVQACQDLSRDLPGDPPPQKI
jgi:hypothetical protein